MVYQLEGGKGRSLSREAGKCFLQKESSLVVDMESA